MKNKFLLSALFFLCLILQTDQSKGQGGMIDKFRQIYTELPTPNTYRTGGGAPGHQYWQQKADYNMQIRLEDENQRVYGEETISYTNNSPDYLEYLWLQMDQNQQAKSSDTNTTAQTHSTIMADLDGDGKKEFITGKRFLAHNGNDAGDGDAPILMYFKFDSSTHPFFQENIIDIDSGAGLNIEIKDMNKDNKLDIIISNKNGVFILENQMIPKKRI